MTGWRQRPARDLQPGATVMVNQEVSDVLVVRRAPGNVQAFCRGGRRLRWDEGATVWMRGERVES